MKLAKLIWASAVLAVSEAIYIRRRGPLFGHAISNLPKRQGGGSGSGGGNNGTNSTTPPPDPMYQLSTDKEFNFQLLRPLALAPYGGGDIGEVLVAAGKIPAGDIEAFSTAFNDLADSVHAMAMSIDPKYTISIRDTMFRASTYFRSADFFLHGNWSDPRIYSLWDQQMAAFDVAMKYLPMPGVRITLPTDGFDIPCIYYSTGMPGKRPTVILGTGYDGAQEELLHIMGWAALERGINVITYEGPGQESVRRSQNIGFIPEWEKVVTPIVDFLLTIDEVDEDAIGLIGLSFGGWLAPRAAAFEHRIAAVMAIDGVYDFGESITGSFPPEFLALIASGNASAVNDVIQGLLMSNDTSTSTIWGIQQGMWSFNAPTAYDWFVQLPPYTLEGIVQNIQCPVFVGDSELDMFYAGQPPLLAKALGDLATYHFFSAASGAGDHCSLGASLLQNQVVFDWFMTTVGYDGPESGEGMDGEDSDDDDSNDGGSDNDAPSCTPRGGPGSPCEPNNDPSSSPGDGDDDGMY